MWIGSFAYIACILLLGWGYWWYTSVLSFNIGIEYACMSQGVQSFVRKKLISFFVGSILFLLVFIFIYLRFVSDGMKIASLIALNVTLPIVMVWVIQVLGIVNLTSLKFLEEFPMNYILYMYFLFIYRKTIILWRYIDNSMLYTIHSNGIHAKSWIEVY